MKPSLLPRSLVGAITVAFVLRCVIVALKGPVGTDEALYLVLGRNFWAGDGYTLLGSPHLIFPPLFPFVLGGIARLIGSEEWASRMVYVLAGTALVPVLFSIAKRTLGEGAARGTAWLTAASPALTVYVASWFWGSMSEPLFLLLAMSAWLAVLVATDETTAMRQLGAAGVAGALIGAAYLVRPEGVAYLPLAVLAMLGASRVRIGRRVLASALAVTVFAGVALPYVSYLHEHTGRWSLSGKSGRMLRMVFAMLGDDPLHRPEDLDVLAYEELGFKPVGDDGSLLFFLEDEIPPEGTELTFLTLAREDPGMLALHVLMNGVDLLATLPHRSVHPLPLLGLAVVGLGAGLRRGGGRRRGALLVLLATLPIGGFLLYGIIPRFLSPVVPPLLVLSGAGLVVLGEWWAARRGADGVHYTRVLTAVVVTALVGFSALKLAKTKIRVQEPVEYRLIGEWARSELPEHALLLCRKPEIAYYANRPMVPLPVVDGPRQLVEFARRRGGTHVVLDRYAVWGTRPALRPLFDETQVPPGLELVHRIEVAGRPTLVYRVTPE